MPGTGHFECQICAFFTDRQQHLDRHLLSKQHKTLQFFANDDSERDECTAEGAVDDFVSQFDSEPTELPEDREIIQTDNNEHDGEEMDETGSQHFEIDDPESEWFPFSSKAEMMLHIFMNSTTHPVSEGVVSYVIFMMKELGVNGVPTLRKLKDKKFGSYSWENLISKGNSDDNIPVWIMKPSEVLKLSIANPSVSNDLVRGPENTHRPIAHPANGERWREIKFDEACNDQQLPVVTMPIKLFLDDTSALKSKKWMALHCIQMQLSGLPLSFMQRQGSIQFVGATEKADIMDLAAVVIDDVKDMQRNGIKSFDAKTKAPCLVKSSVDIIVADYAMLSYCCNHLGAASTKYCPRCYADSDHFMSLAQRRTPQETQLQIQRINLRSSEQDKKKLRQKKGVKEHRNVIWDVIDPHKDIPVGMLHLIPLGLTKHLVKFIVDKCSESTIKRMQIHLQDVCPESRFQNFFKYIGSRQGKDFKEYLQVAPFNMLYAGVPRALVKMVAYLASIQKLLTGTVFDQQKIDEIRDLIREYHQQVHMHAPELRNKAKTHLLLHVVDDIQRHGPPKAYTEDAFEKNHGVIRNMIFLQNQKARSRDTCIKFAKQFLCMHVVSGGYFEENDRWCKANSSVIRIGLLPPVLSFMGLDSVVKATQRPGTISLFERDHQNKIVTESHADDVILQALLSVNIDDHHFDRYKLKRGSGVRAVDGQLVHSGEWITYLDSEKQECIGVFREGLIVIPERGQQLEFIVIWKATILPEKIMGCLTLDKGSTTSIVPSRSSHVKKIYVVHNCSVANCRVVETMTNEKIEQELVLKKTTHLKHNQSINKFIINKFAL